MFHKDWKRYYSGGGHPPACNCVDCTNARLGRSATAPDPRAASGRRPPAPPAPPTIHGGGHSGGNGGGLPVFLGLLIGAALGAGVVFAIGNLAADDIRRFFASFAATPTPTARLALQPPAPTYTPSATAAPTHTPPPTASATPIPAPPHTPPPPHTPAPTSTSSATAAPTHTPPPTATNTPIPTSIPTSTAIPTPEPTLPACGYAELVLMGAGKKHKPCNTATPVPPPGAAPPASPTSVIASAATPAATSALAPANTPVPTPAPVATNTPLPTTAPTHTPLPTAAPTNTPLPTPALTLPPIALDAQPTVVGYYSDGSASVNLALSLHTEDLSPLPQTLPISVTCAQRGNPIANCAAPADITTPTGYRSAAANLTLRLPMGESALAIYYGGANPAALTINVPERIIGIAPDIWACYADRDTAGNYERDHGCYGWYSDFVEKWRSGAIVKIYAEGHPDYIRATREIFDEELAPLLNLKFQWVDAKADANFVARVGLRTSAHPAEWRRCGYCWGIGGPTDYKRNRGRFSEVTSGRITIFHLSRDDEFLNDYERLKGLLTGVIIHEALHALAPTGHAEPSATISVMSNMGYLTYMDKALLALNSHPLIEPGMTMKDARKLVVLKDELLDGAPKEEFDLFNFLERASANLRHAGAMRMKVRGGVTDERCDSEFGYPEWADLEISRLLKWPDDPQMAHLRERDQSVFIFYSDKAAQQTGDGWRHWIKSTGDWRLISRNDLWDSTGWFVRNSKMHWTLAKFLYTYAASHGKSAKMSLLDRSNGKATVRLEFNPYIFQTQWDVDLTATMVIDTETHEIERYTWTDHNNDWNYCATYTEEAKDIEYGIHFTPPAAVITQSEYALPTEFTPPDP